MASLRPQAVKEALRDAGYHSFCCSEKLNGLYVASALGPDGHWRDSDPEETRARAWQNLGTNLLPALGPRQARQLRLALGGA
jgi:hypothetical protein